MADTPDTARRLADQKDLIAQREAQIDALLAFVAERDHHIDALTARAEKAEAERDALRVVYDGDGNTVTIARLRRQLATARAAGIDDLPERLKLVTADRDALRATLAERRPLMAGIWPTTAGEATVDLADLDHPPSPVEGGQ